MNLMKELPKIAARVLHNTRGSNPEWVKTRLELLAEAYGTAAVATDFEEWCASFEPGEPRPHYPISDYMKVVDVRLGTASEEQTLDLQDPLVKELMSMTYELTSVLPSAKSVAELLAAFPVEEIKGALVEFAEGLTERELKTSMKAFYANGGAGASAIILARRRRDNGNRSSQSEPAAK
jgi:hypothetical protein